MKHEAIQAIDSQRIVKQALAFLNTPLPTDDESLIWWRAVRHEVLEGLNKLRVMRLGEVPKES